MTKLYRLINVQTEEVVAESLDLDGLREVANDIYWQEDGEDFSEAGYDEIYCALLGCDYEVEVVNE